ncbi:hypothetical protein [Paenarthrobacter sp. 2TAF44]|uniref:hypothetical protein n=1 Tax=Paenarthrobacter sp. 2TAF44 TaxID=3233018 RepID=UPI003F94952D
MNAEPWGTPERHGKLDQRKQATDRFRTGNVSLNSLWTYYFGIGGDADELVLDAYLNGLLVLAPGRWNSWILHSGNSPQTVGRNREGSKAEE